ncbi:MAG: D-alanine--D-alanine ligase [Bacilli bacterium]|nr:D-alanine--D-alanine ligase [Bacilli bacterium]
MKLRVGVIFGGESVEHEVSIISAVQAMKSLDEEKYEIIPIYIGKDREWYTGRLLKDIEIYSDLDLMKKYATNVVLCNKGDKFVLIKKNGIKRIIDYIDLVLPVVHGTNVEDGTLQGYLELIGIPYVGSNLYSAAIGQDKVFQKQILESSKLPVTKYMWFFDSEYKENEKEVLKGIKSIGYPVMVKPARLGSSVGISKAKNEDEVRVAIEEAIKYDEKILVEKVVENLIEVNCSVLGNYEDQEASELEEVMGADEFLSYRDKYLGNSKKTGSKGMASTNRILPARLDSKMTNEIKELSKEVFKVLNAAGVIRIDYLIDKKSKKIYINETNTIPGSLSFYLWEATNKPYKQLLDEMINLAIKAYKRKKRKVFSFETNILSNFNGLKGSKGKLKM